MTGNTEQDLSSLTETALLTLYIRALESQRPDALLSDEKAVALVQQIDYDFSQSLAKIDEEVQVAMILRIREIHRQTRDFLQHHPGSVTVHIGCGLDTRFERVDDGQVEWYELDLPEVIKLRRKFIGGEGGRHHFLSDLVLDHAWLDTISLQNQPPYLFLAEGVLMYFEEVQVKSLVLTLNGTFPRGGTDLRCLLAIFCVGE